MADIELVIKIPEEVHEKIQKRKVNQYDIDDICQSVFEGTLLPKGHGRIADMDEAIKCIEEVKGEDAVWAISLIEWACGKRTILEADRAESEEQIWEQ